MTKEYLKMADVFKGSVFYYDNAKYLADADGYCGEFNERDFTLYAANAINSHDELVAEVERLRGAIHDAFIDGCQVGWDMTGEGYNAEYGGPDNDRLHEEFTAIFTERYADN